MLTCELYRHKLCTPTMLLNLLSFTLTVGYRYILLSSRHTKKFSFTDTDLSQHLAPPGLEPLNQSFCMQIDNVHTLPWGRLGHLVEMMTKLLSILQAFFYIYVSILKEDLVIFLEIYTIIFFCPRRGILSWTHA